MLILELKAQTVKVKETGINIFHINDHKGCHYSLPLFKIIEDFTKEFDIKKN